MKGTQLHLFGSDEPERTIPRRQSVLLPLDSMVLMSVVLVLLFVLTFSLGVEKGRKAALKAIDSDRARVMADAGKHEQAAEVAALISDEPIKMEKIDPPRIPLAAPARDVAGDNRIDDSQKYMIQLASYAAEGPAQTEAKKLEKNGYSVQLAQKGKFIVIFAGEYPNKTAAEDSMSTLKKRYKDCFLRKL